MWLVSCPKEVFLQEGIMQMAITFMAVIGGLIFSLAVALLAEELIFGQVFRLFFVSEKLASQRLASDKLARQVVAAKSVPRR
jgi:ABC-type enterobactin transport system permease subunit